MSQADRITEIRTAKQQYISVVRTLRNICVRSNALLAIFDAGYRESIATFEVDDFLSQGCALTSAMLIRAAHTGCQRVVAHISASSQPTPEELHIRTELTSHLVTVALDGLSIAPSHMVIRAPQSAVPLHEKPAQCRPPSRRPSSTQLDIAIQAIDPTTVHYRHCPRPTVPCNTCSSAFKLLDMTACSHRGEWCTSVGYYPHFTARLGRRFAQQHRDNQCLRREDLNTIDSSVSEVSSHTSSNVLLDRPVTELSWAQQVEDEAARAQAEIAVVRDDMELDSLTRPSTSQDLGDVGVDDSISQVGRRVREFRVPSSRDTASISEVRPNTRTGKKAVGKRQGSADKRTAKLPKRQPR